MFSFARLIYIDTVHALWLVLIYSLGILQMPPFVNHKGKDVNSDWLAGQWDERSILGHAQINKGRMKDDEPEIDTAQTQKRFGGRLALQEKIQKTFTDSILNNYMAKILKNFLGIFKNSMHHNNGSCRL